MSAGALPWVRAAVRHLGVVGVVVALTAVSVALSVGLAVVLLPLLGQPLSWRGLVLAAVIPAVIAAPATWGFSALVDALDRAEREVARLARSDPLTGADNRRAFRDDALEELLRAARYGYPVSLLMLDVDHFKALNDTRGHAAGDAALVQLTSLLRERLRSSDRVARYGGEEFAVLLPHTDADAAAEIAERLRAGVEPLGFTVSAGVAEAAGAELDALLGRADVAMYRAKEAGRNRVERA